ncbi:MAG: radical SAM protein [Deltaproteobacteria bacterium]|nr:radical SAM protein [Deltaproteobacteria bacterium]
MYKLSDYIVTESISSSSHPDEQQLLCFSTRSATLKLLPQKLYNRLKTRDFSDIPDQLIKNLVQDMILVDMECDELNTVLDENTNQVKDSRVFKLVIQPTAACPLGCHYCGQNHKSKMLSLADQDKITDFARRQISRAKGQITVLNIVWFGAEPLSGMPALQKLSDQLQKLALELNLRYRSGIVTNGLLLNPKLFEKLVVDHKVTHFDITLDGDKDAHDQRRHLKDGKPSFDIIFSNITKIAQRNDLNFSLNIRCNTDDRNRDGVSRLLKKMADHGVHKKANFYVAPIHSWGNDAHELAADKAEFAGWEIDWFIEMRKLGFHIEPLPKRKPQVCMAVSENAYLIDPYGSIFGCSELSLVDTYKDSEGNEIHKIGDVRSENLMAEDRRIPFLSVNQSIKEKRFTCHECVMLPACGGHCPKEWEEGVIPCPSFKFNMKERMLLYYMMQRKLI